MKRATGAIREFYNTDQASCNAFASILVPLNMGDFGWEFLFYFYKMY